MKNKLFECVDGNQFKLSENSSDPTHDEMMEFLLRNYGKDSRDEAEVAIYWFANHYHGGQWTNLYSALSTSPFSPGPISQGPKKDSIESDMYQSLEQEFGQTKQMQETNQQEKGGWRITAVGYPGMTTKSSPKYAIVQDYTSQYLTQDGEWDKPMYSANFWSREEAQKFADQMVKAGKLSPQNIKEDGNGGGTGMGMSVTGGVQGYSTPNAFSKRRVNEMSLKSLLEAEMIDPTTGDVEPGPRDRFDMQSSNTPKVNKFTVDYAVSGLEQIPSSHHTDKKQAMMAALEFLKPYASKKSGDKVIKLDNGYAIKDGTGATVAIATLKPYQRGLEEGTTSPYFERLDQALTAVEEYIVKNGIQVDPNEHPQDPSDPGLQQTDPYRIREPFLYGGINYDQSKTADYKLSTYKGKPTKKYLHVNISRTEQGRYELNLYVL